ncbi:MAG: flavodoxin-like domain-containing protein [Prevotellaceae bacterium]|jgi:hypothetical protein|nr:flavodoxin-like domain-containing protein [Prevotellaceae bacterium]
MAKIAVFYYTQTGQTLQVAQSVCRPLAEAGHTVVYRAIVPEQPLPYPCSAKSFFHTFPESREAIPCKIAPVDLSDIAGAELVIIAYQVWFLSPSTPFHAFFQNPAIQQYLNGKRCITITGCRNMWVMAQAKAGGYLRNADGKLVGNIVLQDRHPNLISVLTIVRWLFYGKKEKSGLLPAAGISAADLQHAAVFGEIIAEVLRSGGWDSLQERLLAAGAVGYKPAIVFMEKTGYRIFGVWAKFILRKGERRPARRAFLLKLFKYYLFVVLYVIAPVGLIFFYLACPFRYAAIRKDRKRQTMIPVC